MKRNNKKLPSISLATSAFVTFLIFGNLPHNHFHPLLIILSLLPLQLGALIWAAFNGYRKSFTKNLC